MRAKLTQSGGILTLPSPRVSGSLEHSPMCSYIYVLPDPLEGKQKGLLFLISVNGWQHQQGTQTPAFYKSHHVMYLHPCLDDIQWSVSKDAGCSSNRSKGSSQQGIDRFIRVIT